MSNRTLSTPAELKDFCIGKQIFANGGYECDCTTEAQRMGWQKAFSRYMSTSMGWDIYEESPAQAVIFSETALAAATNRPEYHLQGVDYTEPSVQ